MLVKLLKKFGIKIKKDQFYYVVSFQVGKELYDITVKNEEFDTMTEKDLIQRIFIHISRCERKEGCRMMADKYGILQYENVQTQDRKQEIKMKEIELVVGEAYTCGYEPRIKLEFIGKDKNGCPVFKPLNEFSRSFYTLYSEKAEAYDPICKKGYLGFMDTDVDREFVKIDT